MFFWRRQSSPQLSAAGGTGGRSERRWRRYSELGPRRWWRHDANSLEWNDHRPRQGEPSPSPAITLDYIILIFSSVGHSAFCIENWQRWNTGFISNSPFSSWQWIKLCFKKINVKNLVNILFNCGEGKPLNSVWFFEAVIILFLCEQHDKADQRSLTSGLQTGSSLWAALKE